MPSKNAQKLRQIERQLFFLRKLILILRCAHAAFKAAKLTRERRARLGAMGRSAQPVLLLGGYKKSVKIPTPYDLAIIQFFACW